MERRFVITKWCIVSSLLGPGLALLIGVSHKGSSFMQASLNPTKAPKAEWRQVMEEMSKVWIYRSTSIAPTH